MLIELCTKIPCLGLVADKASSEEKKYYALTGPFFGQKGDRSEKGADKYTHHFVHTPYFK